MASAGASVKTWKRLPKFPSGKAECADQMTKSSSSFPPLLSKKWLCNGDQAKQCEDLLTLG